MVLMRRCVNFKAFLFSGQCYSCTSVQQYPDNRQSRFMPADALFTFAMACNVYLTFFKQYDSVSLRKLEWRYLSLCYGLPFIPALTFLCIDTAQRGKVYGSANVRRHLRLEFNC